MDEFFILLAIFLLAFPIAAIVALVVALNLKGRTAALEQRIARLEAAGRPSAAPVAYQGEIPPLPVVDLVAPETPAEPPREAPADVAEPEPIAAMSSGALPPPLPPPPAPPPPPKPQPGFEERLGARWTVWVGGVALALGGLFLVRYSIEQGLLGPGARTFFGALFAIALCAAGEWLRRREQPLAMPGFVNANVPAVLTAAGTATAFGTAYAAYALYGFLAPGVAFVLLGAIALAAMAASALHGPALAALGLVGALGAPLLIESDNPNLWALALYLAFVVSSTYGLARLRRWKWLAQAGAVGALLWTFPLAVGAGSDIAPVMAHLLIQMALAGFFLVAHPYRGVPDEAAHPDRMASLILAAFAVLAVLVSGSGAMGSARPAFAGTVVLLLVGLAIRYAPAAPAALAGAFVACGTLLLWPVASEVAREPFSVVPDLATSPRPAALETFLGFALFIPGLVALASLWRLSVGRLLPLATAAFFAGAATLGPLAALTLSYWRVAALEPSLSFALVAGLLAAAFAGAAMFFAKRTDDPRDPLGLALGASAAAAIAALSLGLTFALDKGMLTVAFALTALGTAWVADRTGVPILRAVVAALALLVLGRVVYEPTIVGGDPGRTPIFNWLLWGYGVPAVAFYAASRLLERAGRDRIVRLVESLAILFAALLATFEIRHLVQGGDPFAETTDHLEIGLLATVGLGFSLVMVRAQARKPDIVYHVGSLVFGALSMFGIALGLILVANPYLEGGDVTGGALINSLLPGYLLPGLMAGGLAVVANGLRPTWYVKSARALAAILPALYVLLEIRRLFQGPDIRWSQPTSQAELWTYSVALLAFGIVFLALGLQRDLRALRLASAGCIMAAVLKVFIIDLSNLEGVTRALSFIGLGLALVGIGFVYQKLLARRPPPPAEDAPAPPPLPG